MFGSMQSFTTRLQCWITSLFLLALLAACGANTDVVVIDADAQNNAAVAKTSPVESWTVVTTTAAGDGYLLYGNDTYQWLDTTCIADLRGASITVTTIDWNEISNMTQLSGVGDCATTKAHFADAGGVWRVVTTTANGDGYVLFGDGKRQWLDAACIARVRTSGINVRVVQWREISGTSQQPGRGDCNAVIDNSGSGGGSASDKWQLVTTTTNGDGYVIYLDNTRQWLSANCMIRLKRSQAFIREESWEYIADIPQIAGIGDCDAVAQNAKTGETTADSTCNKLTNGNFEARLQNWQSQGSVSLVDDAHNGIQAVNLSNGSLSYEVPVSEIGTEITFFGYYKGNGPDTPAYVGVDFLRDGQKIGDEVTALTPRWASSIYSLFMRNATVPATATSVRVWVYTEHAVMLDDLELRDAGCSSGPPVAGTYLTAPEAICTLSTYTREDYFNGWFLTKIAEEPVAGTSRIDLDIERGNMFADGLQIAQANTVGESDVLPGVGTLYSTSHGPTKASIDDAPSWVYGGALRGNYKYVRQGSESVLTHLGYSISKGRHFDDAGNEVFSTVLDCLGEIR